MNINNPEILAPGGSFNSAIHALKSGADAVYIGLTSFSARKSATNFTMDQLRRLKTYCFDNSKKIYVAINTLLKDTELSDLYPLLKQLEDIEVDAIIIQDLGLANIIRKNTNLPLHASTQLGVHNIHGVKTLKHLGFTRAVLSRELTLKEIQDIKKQFPKMELEIFIHGALCYGFSGLCLASSKLLDRSANRGECGQICRTWFNVNGKKEYSFSLNDLSLQEKVLKLKEIGVESLKIEGRMKGPGYVSATSELYYNILNNKDFKEPLKRSLTEFNRTAGDAYLNTPKGHNSINKEYPSHLGLPVGEILSVDKNSFSVKLSEKIENRDGLLVLSKTKPYTSIKFAANIINIKSDIAILKGSIPENTTHKLYKISSHDKHLKEEKTQSYKPWKSKVELKIEIINSGITIETDYKTFSYIIELQPAKNPVDLNKQFHKIFYSGGETEYNFICNVVNSSDINDPFIPSSKLKEIRNSFQIDFINNIPVPILKTISTLKIPSKKFVNNRNSLPFVTDFSELLIENLNKFETSYLLPLAPVIFNSEDYLSKLKTFLENNSDYNFVIGLNNISQLSYIPELSSDTEYYCDYGLYCVNNHTTELLNSLINNLKWTTVWVETDKEADYPPLFISRTCFKANESGCPVNCNKKLEQNISQNSKNYKVIVDNCISYTLLV
ncbi:MAG: U32 family peptidase [Spirochaetaceae bacterium]